jgi:hypothetical protein
MKSQDVPWDPLFKAYASPEDQKEYQASTDPNDQKNIQHDVIFDLDFLHVDNHDHYYLGSAVTTDDTRKVDLEQMIAQTHDLFLAVGFNPEIAEWYLIHHGQQ